MNLSCIDLGSRRRVCYISFTCNYLKPVAACRATPFRSNFLAPALNARSRDDAAPRRNARLDLFRFLPFRLNRLAAEVSNALSGEYQARYGLDIPEWRVLATLGFREDACSAQYISDCTRTHKSTISRAVTALLARQIVERVENADDRREFRLRLTRKGRALYEELIPRLLRKEQEILACLTAAERKDFAALLGKIERRLDLVQISAEADAKQAY